MAHAIADDIRHLLSLLDQALEMAVDIRKHRLESESSHSWCEVVTDPTQIETDPVHQLPVCLDRAHEAAAKLFDRLSARPTSRYLMGYLLSREEFCLMAIGGVWIETLWGDSYEAFRMFHYEDSEHRCYIDPGKRPQAPGAMPSRFSIPPENISWSGLRAEQREFFANNLPEVAARFQR